MSIKVDFPQEIIEIMKRSVNFNKPLDMNQLQDLSTFALMYKNCKIVHQFNKYGKFITGCCYSDKEIDSYWFFLDEKYRFYDVMIPKDLTFSSIIAHVSHNIDLVSGAETRLTVEEMKELLELQDIYPLIENLYRMRSESIRI